MARIQKTLKSTDTDCQLSQSLCLCLSYQLIEHYLGAPVILPNLHQIKLSWASVTETITEPSQFVSAEIKTTTKSNL